MRIACRRNCAAGHRIWPAVTSGRSASNYEQLVAIILTSSTFSFGALEEVEAVGEAVELDGEAESSTVPVISTLWPTCGVSLASLASSRYSLADRLAVPEVPVVALGLVVMLVRTNFVSFIAEVEDVDEVVPLVPVGVACARCTQPVTVIALSLELLGVCGGVVCARSPAVHAIDTNAADNNLSFIFPPCMSFGVASCNSAADGRSNVLGAVLFGAAPELAAACRGSIRCVKNLPAILMVE